MESIPIEQIDECRLRAELSSALTANKLLNECLEKRKAEIQTLQKAREREKYTLRQKQKNAERLDSQLRILKAENKALDKRLELLDALEAAGVDNWEGYDEALEILRKNQDG